MRKRRKSSAHWLFLLVGLILLLVSIGALLVFAASQGWLESQWEQRVNSVLEAAQPLVPFLKTLAWLGGIAGSLAGAAFTLLASWHFAEMNLPQRIKDLKENHAGAHLSLQPRFLVLARSGLGSAPSDIETNRLMLLRKWLNWGEKERARVLAASAKPLAREASALLAAAQEAQQQQITAHLIRGYQYASQQNDEKAFEEFEAATKVRVDNIVARDIAAGWARRMNRQEREHELLEEMQKAAISARSKIDHARSLRRDAELLAKRNNDPARVEALSRLRDARKLLQPLVADKEAMIELGRVHTLFCEVRCDRGKAGHLSGPNQPLTRAREYMAGVVVRTRPEEPEGEAYGEDRVARVEERVVELRDDLDAGDGDDR